MNTETINIKIDPETKREAQRIAKALGFSLSSILKAFLKQLIATKRLSFSLPEEPSEALVQAIKEAEEDYKEGRTITFQNADEALKYVDRLDSNNEKKNKKHRLLSRVRQAS